MKLKKGIVLGNIDGQDFAIATGKLSKDFQGLINNNPTANYVFKLLQNEQTEESIVDAMFAKYDAPKEQIQADVHELLENIKAMGILEDNA